MAIKTLLAFLIPDVPKRLVVASRMENERVNSLILRGKFDDRHRPDVDRPKEGQPIGYFFRQSDAATSNMTEVNNICVHVCMRL